MDQPPLSGEYWQEDKFLNTLAEAYRLQEAIIGATELAVLSTNLEGTLTSFNRAAEDLLGYKAEEVIGKETPVLFHDQSEILKRAEELERTSGFLVKSMFEVLSLATLKNKSPERSEWTFIHKNGKRFPVSLSVTVLVDENDQVFGFAAIATDITEQKAAEKRLKESEAHLKAILTSSDASTVEIDEHGRYINIWSNHVELGGVPVRDLRNKTFADLFGKEFSKPFDELRKKVLSTGEPQEIELKSPTPGDDRWYSIKYARIYDENSRPTNRISCSISNITKRKKAEFALRESEEKFRTMAQNIPGAIYLCNNDATYSMVYLNDKVEEITGFKASQFLNGEINFVQLYHPEDSPAIIAAVDKALAEKTNFNIEYRLKHRSLEWRWIKESGLGVYDDDGKLILIEGVIMDITAQKLAEEEYQKVAKQNHSIFNNAVNLNAVTGFDGYFKRVNPMWTEITGWTQEELTTKPFLSFVHPEDKESTTEAANYLAAGHNLHTFENRYRCKDGTYRWLLWSSAVDTKNKLIYATAIDITERKKSEDDLLLSKKGLESLAIKLQEQNRQLDEFAHIISHNLRSPIGNIKALIGLLNDNSSMDDYRLIFDKLKNLSVNLGETMNDLMDTLKVKKEPKIECIEIRFKDIMDKVIQSLEGELIRSGASITFEFNKAPTVVYSRAYMESIMLNLMSNAIKYRALDRKPTIHLESSIEGNTVQLRVSDNGLGIDMQKYGDKLFGLHKTFHGNKEARGVGLFLIKTQVEALGGSIQATSDVGKGTTFIINFS
jgi:PAS domain S-box-containing protein